MRYYYIDVLKVFCAFFVVLLHTTAMGIYNTNQPEWCIFIVFNSLTRFAVPLFVLCSGAMLLRPEKNNIDTFSLLALRLKKIGIPLLFWSMFYEVHLILNGSEKNFMMIIQDFLSGDVMYHLWFLYMLMSLYIISPVLCEIKIKIGKYFFLVWIIFCVIFLIRNIYHFSVSTYIFYISPYVCYFFLGYWIHESMHENLNKSLTQWMNFRVMSMILAICVFSIAYGTICVTQNSLNEMFFANDNLFVVIGSLIIFYVCRLKEETFKKLCNRWIPYFSKLTFGVYLIHVYVLGKIYYSLLGGDIYSVKHPVMVALALSVPVFLISMLVTAILKKIPGLRSVV